MVLNVLFPPLLEGQYCFFFSVYKHRALKLVGLIIDLTYLMVWICHLHRWHFPQEQAELPTVCNGHIHRNISHETFMSLLIFSVTSML